jgi:hypothetical protein
MSASVLEQAGRYVAAGFSVIPIRGDTFARAVAKDFEGLTTTLDGLMSRAAPTALRDTVEAGRAIVHVQMDAREEGLGEKDKADRKLEEVKRIEETQLMPHQGMADVLKQLKVVDF